MQEKYVLKVLDTGEEITVRDVQMELLSMMKDIDALCKKHGITYFLVAGSALGAVRHKGFIPWDDDLDIGMSYDDYVKFIDVLKHHLSDQYVFQCFDTHKEYNVTIPTMKIRKKGTYLKERNHLLANKCKDGDGVFVDVFVYDSVSEHKWYDVYQRSFNYLLMPLIVGIENLGCNPYFLKKLYVNHARKYHRKQRGSRKIGIDATWVFQRITKNFNHLYDDVFPVKYVPFEDTTLPIPNHPHPFLCVEIAPSYMTPPKPEDRVPKHIEDIDLHHDHKEKKKGGKRK